MTDFSKPRRALCVFLGLCAASAFILALGNRGMAGGITAGTGETFTVTQRFYGMDAGELERIAAIPLENALSGIAGVRRIYGSCENGRVRIIARFEGRVRGRYEAVREAAQRVYETLPSAAQRPEISSSGDSRVPVWTAAVTAPGGKSPGMILEKILKPALEGLPGAGEVEISGAGLTEIVITLKSEEALARNIDAGALARALAYNDALLPGGTLRDPSRTGGAQELPVMVDGRYGTGGMAEGGMAGELKNALVPVPAGDGTGKNFVPLQDLADITEQERDYENRSRLNGKEAALIAVMGSDGADLGKLSLLIGEELAKYKDLEFTVLSDAGEAERRARGSVMGAALQGACFVALLAALLCSRREGSFSAPFFCALTVPAACFFSSALLALLGRPPDKLVLAGLACGAGAAVDASILSAEYFRSCRSPAEGKKALEQLRFPLISGAVTTIAALLPLMVRGGTGMNSVAWAIAAVNFTAMVLALTLLPPLFLWTGRDKKLLPAGRFLTGPFPVPGKGPRRNKRRGFPVLRLFHEPRLFRRRRFRGRRFCRRGLALVIGTVVRKPAAVLGGWILITVLGCVSLVLKGADVEQGSSGDYVYAQVEFDGGLHISETDRLLAAYGEELKNYPGIESVQTVARTGTGSVMTGFDPLLVKEKTVREWMRSLSLPGGFVYMVEPQGNERSWRIRVSGDEEKRCQELAAEAGRICSALEGVSETVLHFKEGSPRLDLEAERDKLAFGGMSYGSIGEAVRRTIHGPVAYKRMAGDLSGSAGYAAETDVRIRGGTEVLGREGVFDILIRNENPAGAPLRLDSLVTAEPGRDASSIQREDRRRCASFSIRTPPMDPRRVRDRVMESLAPLDLPPGYRVDFDPEAIKAAGGVSAQACLFVLALLLCYMLIAAFKESFSFPLAVLAVVPPSLAVPALWMVLGAYPLNEVSAAAFVAVSGMAVNAAVLVADHLQDAGTRFVGQAAPATQSATATQSAPFRQVTGSFYRIFRKRLPVLGATAGTTVAGALPFLFVGAGAAQVVKTLSLVGALGVAVSALCAATLIPALVKVFPGVLKPFVPGQKQ